MNSESAELESFVRRWAAATPMLEQAARRELQEMSFKEHRLSIEALFQLSETFVGGESTPATCGLVEQQRIFGLLPR